MSEFIGDAALVLLGAVLAVLGERVLDSFKQRRQGRSALRMIERMLSSVQDAVGHKHDFTNKQDWYKELEEMANAEKSWLGDLYTPAKLIAWRIRDQSFSHEESDSIEYCCDELILDLSLLQLVLLPRVPMRGKERGDRARELAGTILLCRRHDVGPPTPVGRRPPSAGPGVPSRGGTFPGMDKDIDDFLRNWEDGKVTLDRKYAMSSVLGFRACRL